MLSYSTEPIIKNVGVVRIEISFRSTMQQKEEIETEVIPEHNSSQTILLQRKDRSGGICYEKYLIQDFCGPVYCSLQPSECP